MNKKEKRKGWEYVLGIQKIDDYKPSKEYMDLIEKEVNGDITLEQMKEIIIEKYTMNQANSNEWSIFI